MDSNSSGTQNDDGVPTAPQLDGFRTERLLGTGGSATVWLIRSSSTGDPFALKLAASSRGVPGMDPTAVLRELTLLSRFRHEHLLRVHELIGTDQGPALRMDFAAGGSLLDLVSARGPLPPGEAVTILTPIAQALAFLHSEGAVHGDVSPGNILFSAEGKPFLADLGVGRLLGEGVSGAAGTPGFQDQHGSTGWLNIESDVYSLAAVGWFSLTGRVPGPAARRPPLSLLVPETPDELTAVIESGLHTDPARRPDAREFARAVQRSASALPLDLVSSAHATVLPDLLTRRVIQEQPRRWPRGAGRRIAGQDPAAVGQVAHPGARVRGGGTGGTTRVGDGRRGRRERRERLERSKRPAHGVRALPAFAVVVALALVAAVILTAGPLLSGSPRESRPATASVPISIDATSTPTSAVPSSDPGPNLGPDLDPGSDLAPDTELGAEPDPDLNSDPDVGIGPAAGPAASLAESLSASLAGDDPLMVLPALAEVRSLAYANADPSLLKLVNVQGSAVMATDLEAVSELAERGNIFDGLEIEVDDVALTQAPANNPERDSTERDSTEGATAEADAPEGGAGAGDGHVRTAAVSATATTSGFVERSTGGLPLRTESAAVEQNLVFVLRLEEGRWRIFSVHEAPN